jgi:hypothetical protein
MTKIAGSGSISQRHGSADPDPDPPQMSWIRNTDFSAHLLVQLVGDVGAVLAGALEQTDLLLDPLHLHLQLLLTLFRLLLKRMSSLLGI